MDCLSNFLATLCGAKTNEQKDYLLEVYVYSDDAMVSIWKHNSLVQSYKIDAKCYDVITTQYFKHMDN